MLLEPIVKEFESDPQSMARAYCAVWAVDSFASHTAWVMAADEVKTTGKRRLVEENFKKLICETVGGWRFKVLLEVSNATKHGVRSKTEGKLVPDSGCASAQNVEGWPWYYQNSRFWGDQVVVDLELTWDESAREWANSEGEPFSGSFFNTVPILDIVKSSIEMIEAQITATSDKATPPATPPLIC